MKSFVPSVCALALVAGLMAPAANAYAAGQTPGTQQPPDKQDPKQ